MKLLKWFFVRRFNVVDAGIIGGSLILVLDERYVWAFLLLFFGAIASSIGEVLLGIYPDPTD